ncbi:MAG: N-acetyltransferase [Phycisphaerales bacterium]|nr:MAG: N-acetyltransferase [Phycisphaerales bacterium]
MKIAISVQDADHRDPGVARAIHAVQMAAYAQEAALLGARDFPPLRRTVDDIRRGAERFLVAVDEGAIVGALGLAPDDELRTLNIDSLVVAPERQREGVGRALVAAAIDRHAAAPLSVSTGVKNLPALALYAGFGFTESHRAFKGEDPIEVVTLRRAPSQG